MKKHNWCSSGHIFAGTTGGTINYRGLKINSRHQKKHIAVDVETTGLSPRYGARVIEVAALVVEDGVMTETFHSLVQPGVRVPAAVQRVHGISNAALEGQPGAEEVFGRFMEFIGDATLVAHNAVFDMGFLRAEFSRLGLHMTNPGLCTLKMSRELIPGLPDYKLATVYRSLVGELPHEPQHRALTDARMAGRIWMELMKGYIK